MAQPKPSTTEMSMPTFETLEEWTRSQIQSLMQSVLDEEVTHALDGRGTSDRHRWTQPAATAMGTGSGGDCP